MHSERAARIFIKSMAPTDQKSNKKASKKRSQNVISFYLPEVCQQKWLRMGLNARLNLRRTLERGRTMFK